MNTQCNDLEDKLLDLIYGELPEAEATQLRAHAETCASCGASLAKLTSARRLARALPLVEPRPELTVAIMEKARAKMRPAETARADAPPPRAVAARRSFWAALAARLGTFLVGPQAAMAAVTVLMVGIGLYYFPRLRSHEPVQGGRTVDPDPTGEAGPSAEIEPAAPLDLRYDPRTRRIVDARDVRPTPPAAQLRPVVADTTQDEHAETPPEDPNERTRTVDTENRAAGDHVAQDTPTAMDGDEPGRVVQNDLVDDGAERDHDGVATLDIAPGGSIHTGSDRAAMPRHAAPATQRTSVGDLEGARLDELAGQAAQGQAPSAPMMRQQVPVAPAPPPVMPREEQLAPPPPGNADSAGAYRVAAPRPSTNPAPSTPTYALGGSSGATFGAGTTGSNGTGVRNSAAAGGGGGGVYTYDSVPPSTPAQEPLAPLALHRRARAESQTAPQAAIRDYVALLARYPTYPESAQAMLELAELYRRTGELGQARVWISRAESSPVTRENARRMRVQLDEMDRAARVPEAAANRAAEAPTHADTASVAPTSN